MGTLFNGGKPLGFSAGDIAGKGIGGQVINGLLGSLFDPGNITGMFGHNVGPAAFMAPSGSGGGLFPGQSLGSKGIFGINPEGSAGLNSSSSNMIGSLINAIGGGIAGGSALGGSGMLGNLFGSGGASSGTFADGAGYSTAGMSADVPSAVSGAGGASGGMSTFQEGQLGLQALPMLTKLLGIDGSNNQANAPAGQHSQVSPPLPTTPMGPQNMGVPSQNPNSAVNNANGTSNAGAAGLLAYLKSQGMLNA